VTSEAADAAIDARNVSAWRSKNYLREYLRTSVEVNEAVILARHREALKAATLEIGCGAGRITRVLAGLSEDVQAIDVSPRMVAACAAAVPQARVTIGDLRDLSAFGDGALSAIVAFANVIDVLDDEGRREALREFRRVLRPDGTLLLSTHNRAHIPVMRDTTFDRKSLMTEVGLARAVYTLPALPLRRINRRRARPFERTEPGYAIVNDWAHNYQMLHYYIDRDAMEDQLHDTGFRMLECLDVAGQVMARGAGAPETPSLHLAAVPA
jgi:SAM-dependent methyltransferase